MIAYLLIASDKVPKVMVALTGAGILLAATVITADEAFVLLVRASQQTNRRLADVARKLQP